MRNEKLLKDTSILMYVLNAVIILYYCMIVPATTYRICHSFSAYQFISEADRIPMKPMRMPLMAVMLFFVLWQISFRKGRSSAGNRFPVWSVCAVEIIICVLLIESLNFYYSGIALLVLTDLVNDVRNNRVRFLLIGLLMLIFAVGRYEVLPVASSRTPFSVYLEYYKPGIRMFLSGIESTLVSANTLLFVFYMVQLFAGQKEENERIQSLNNQLSDANLQLKKINAEMERMTEIRERNRFAREIHDTLGHTLTGIIMGSQASLALFDINPGEARKKMETVTQSARDGLADVRQSIKALRPDALEKHNLDQALEEMIIKFQATTSAFIRYEQEAGSLDFAEDEEDTLYRIIQECMTNAVRHGHADYIRIRMSKHDDVLVIDIRDNGKGCSSVTEGFGLRHMQERLDLLSGSLTYGNRRDDPGDGENGFYVIASLPVRKKEEEQKHDQSADC